MKCIVRQYVLGGGAPKSVFEYLMILKNRGYQVINLAIPDEDEILKKYQDNFGPTLIRNDVQACWDERKYISAYRELRYEFDLIKKEKADLVIAIGEGSGYFLSYLCKKMNIPCIIIIAGGDITKNSYLAKYWENKQVICFSEENKDVLLKYYPKDYIWVISNRIKISKVFSDIETHYSDLKEINILIISRIVPDKINSIYHFLEYLIKNVYRESLHIKIAGRGASADIFTERIKRDYATQLDIELIGHIDNLEPYYEWAHIVVGKGRSVIEPIMMNRIGCIIGEDGKAVICSESSLDNLYHYNFSGRNIDIQNNIDSVGYTLKSLIDGFYDFNSLKRCIVKVREKYETSYLHVKFGEVLDQSVKDIHKNSQAFIFLRYLKFCFLKLSHKLQTRNSVSNE